MRKTPQMLLIEERDPGKRDLRDIITEAYSAGGSLEKAGRILGVDAATLSKWIRALDGEIASQVIFEGWPHDRCAEDRPLMVGARG